MTPLAGDLHTRLKVTLGGAFVIERELGGGGMSRVFVAEETRLGRKVVVKVLSPELAEGISVERFEREIRLAASLQHAHIVPVLSTGDVDGLPWFSMPFIEGESLRARVARGALPIGECISILRDVARALTYAHGRDVVHRDIKPDNVMFSAGSAVVTDFGIAKALSASRTGTGSETLTQLGTSIGTPAYMAPEQAAGDPNVDARADIYAFGCTAYELLTGSSPFAGRTPQRMLAAHMAEIPRDVREIRVDTPAALAELVMRSLAKDANDRPQSAEEIARTLDTITSGSMTAQPAILLGGPAMFRRALLIYVAAFVAVMILAKAAIVGIGLPDWVFPGALIVMALGLPVILFTAYAQRINRQLATATPTRTPGGTVSVAAPNGAMATFAVRATPYLGWTRAARGGALALAAFVALVGGFMALRAIGIGPFGSLLAAGQVKAKQEVLVTDFTVSNADTSLGRVLGDATRATLASSSAITLTAPVAVAAGLQRMQRDPHDAVTLDLARQLALRNRIPAVITGELTGLGAGGFIVTLRMITTDSARTLASFQETARDPSALIAAIDHLSRSLRARLGESLKAVRSTEDLNDATTSSLEALRKFTAGERLYELDRNYRPAIALLREAVGIDPTFAAAWREMGVVAGSAGGAAMRALRDSALTQAYRYRDRLQGSELDVVVAAYWSYPGHDRAKAAEAYESMLRRGDSAVAATNLAGLLESRREYARATSLYAAQDRACPHCFRPMFGSWTVSLLRQQRYREADSVATDALSRFPKERNLKLYQVQLLALKGDTGAFRRQVDSVRSKGDSADRGWSRSLARNLALRDGNIAEWRKLLADGRTDPSVATPLNRFAWATSVAEALVTRSLPNGRAMLEARLDSATTNYDIRPVRQEERDYLNVVAIYALAGRPEKARAWLARYDTEITDTALRRDQAPDRSWAVAYLAMAEGKYRDAITAFRASDRKPDGPAAACDLCLSLELAEAFDSAGQADSAIAHYEREAHGNSFDRLAWDGPYLARTLYRLGQLYEARGDLARAAQDYRDFIALWKNADPLLQPQVAEARARLSRLGDQPATVALPKKP